MSVEKPSVSDAPGNKNEEKDPDKPGHWWNAALEMRGGSSKT